MGFVEFDRLNVVVGGAGGAGFGVGGNEQALMRKTEAGYRGSGLGLSSAQPAGPGISRDSESR